jgi:hypothetical protein
MPVLMRITPATLPRRKMNDLRSGNLALTHSPAPTAASTTAMDRLSDAQFSCVGGEREQTAPSAVGCGACLRCVSKKVTVLSGLHAPRCVASACPRLVELPSHLVAPSARSRAGTETLAFGKPPPRKQTQGVSKIGY